MRTKLNETQPPILDCEVCSAKAGEWCEPTCSEAPVPMNVNTFGDVLQSAITLLATSIDKTAVKNYVEMNLDWSREILPNLPFHKVSLTFYRHDGLSPHALKLLAEEKRAQAEEDRAFAIGRLDACWEREIKMISEVADLKTRIAELESELEETQAIAHEQAEIIARGEVQS